ncbi:MAG: DUF222 domain-containing protein, partial [Acidimicrobiia bacterium]|nr:DUF222 domain-containing protein [Acidimicrobiia bacterium]
MSNLMSVVDELHATPAGDLADDEVTAELVEVVRAEQRLAARRVALVAVADRRRFFEVLGFGSAMAWLRSLLGVRHGVARWWVTLGRALRHMPGARTAFMAGDLAEDRLRPLVEARTHSPGAYADGEETLLDAARDLGPSEFRRVVEYWKDAVDPDRFAARRETMVAERGLHVSLTWEGRARVDGWLDPESHAVVDAALGVYVDRATRDPGDDRTPAQARVDGLVDICRSFLRHATSATRGGEPVQVLVTVDLETLERRSRGRGAIGDRHITAEEARRLACDAKITRV